MRNAFSVLLLGCCFAVLMGCEQKTATVEQSPIERGKYLVTISGCHDCHTPKVMSPSGVPELNMELALSGHPADARYPTWKPEDLQQNNAIALTDPMLSSWAGPWGVSFAANLTPDKETGLAEWTEDTFIQAMRTGKHQGQPNGRDILPPMPWPGVAQMTDDDLKAVFAYLHSLPPVKNQVPFPVPPSAPPAQ